MLEAVPGRGGHQAGHPARRSRQHQPMRALLGARRGNAAPVGLHHQERRRDARLGGRLRGALHVPADDRPKRSVDDGGRGARILAELAGHLARQRDRNAGQRAAQGLAQPAFVAIVEVTEQQADRHRIHVQRGDLGDDTVDLGVLQRDQHLLGAGQSLGHLDARVALDEIVGPVRRQAVHVGPAGLAIPHDVAEAARRQQPHRRQVAGQNRVGGHRGAVAQQADVGDGHALACECVDGVRQATRRIIGCRRHFGHQHPAVVGAGHRIGEGAARVDAHGPTWSVHGDHLSGWCG